MTSLALIAAEYRQQLATLADLDIDPQTLADTIEAIQGPVEEKARAKAFAVRAIEADAAQWKQWAKQALEHSNALYARAEFIEADIAKELSACGIQKVSGPGISISWRKSKAADVFNPAMLPDEYWIRPPAPEPYPGKAAILEALKAGKEVPGARIENRQHLQIK